MDNPDYEFDIEPVKFRKHFCRFSVIKRTISNGIEHIKWVERCRCARVKMVDCKFIVEGSKIPEMTIVFFDRNGKQEIKNGQ